MSGTNHVTGGIVFTGIFASFWNINIFATPELLAATGFFSILPDVDHLKSPIGKVFYPLAKFLDRRYGHRTITHSLIVYIPGIFIIMFIEKTFGSTFSYTLVFAFAYFSHLLFDMLTKQGVPLFYPFKRNPCVIPGNADMRLRSSDLKTEAACFAIFILLGITCQNLFANGFWNTYNRQFSDIKHLHQEARISPTMLAVKYHFRTSGNKELQGEGYLVSSSEKEVVLYSKDDFIILSNADRIIKIEPTRTNQVLITHEIIFSNISPDSLSSLLHNRKIISITLQSNTDFSYLKKNKPETGKRAELEFVINPSIEFVKTKAVNQLDTISSRRKILQFDLEKELARQGKLNQDKIILVNRINKLSDEIPVMELYEREKSTKELASLKNQLSNFPIIEDNSGKIRIQLQQLQVKKVELPELTSINGYLTYFTL